MAWMFMFGFLLFGTSSPPLFVFPVIAHSSIFGDTTGCLKKSVILAMMKASIGGPAGAIWCTVGTQKTYPIVPRHALGTYFMLFQS